MKFNINQILIVNIKRNIDKSEVTKLLTLKWVLGNYLKYNERKEEY